MAVRMNRHALAFWRRDMLKRRSGFTNTLEGSFQDTLSPWTSASVSKGQGCCSLWCYPSRGDERAFLAQTMEYNTQHCHTLNSGQA